MNSTLSNLKLPHSQSSSNYYHTIIRRDQFYIPDDEDDIITFESIADNIGRICAKQLNPGFTTVSIHESDGDDRSDNRATHLHLFYWHYSRCPISQYLHRLRNSGQFRFKSISVKFPDLCRDYVRSSESKRVLYDQSPQGRIQGRSRRDIEGGETDGGSQPTGIN